MSGKAVAGVAGALLALIICCVAGLGFAGGGIAMAVCAAPMTVTSPAGSGTSPAAAIGAWPTVGTWRREQVTNAATIVAVGRQMHVPARGWVIALATAMQESGLRNLGDLDSANDTDSLGLFQQRASQGWGTPAQILDPAYAATKFYKRLIQVANWQNLPLTVAAQDVQRSAYPDAYAKWEDDAFMLANFVGPDVTGMMPADFTQWLDTCTAVGGDGQSSGDSVPLPSGFALPPSTPPAVVTAVLWALAQLGTPYAFGGDCSDSHGGNPSYECDCSSLTMMAYRQAGLVIPRTAADQSHVGVGVNGVSQLLPGDLLFIPGSDGTASSPGHVGLYIGQGLLVQSPHTGDHVKITQLSNWASGLAGMRRIVNS
jgi:cell wall-associated NlpC family hydrolase